MPLTLLALSAPCTSWPKVYVSVGPPWETRSKAGMHPMAVKEMMGHSSIRVTYDVYGHLFPTMHEASIASLEAAFPSAKHREEKGQQRYE